MSRTSGSEYCLERVKAKDKCRRLVRSNWFVEPKFLGIFHILSDFAHKVYPNSPVQTHENNHSVNQWPYFPTSTD